MRFTRRRAAPAAPLRDDLFPAPCGESPRDRRASRFWDKQEKAKGEKRTVDYNKTLNLPKTDFPMRAALPQREPGMAKTGTRAGGIKRL